MKLFLTLFAALIVVACSEQSEQAKPKMAAALPAANPVSTQVYSGSGFAELEGSVINYSYEDFGGFSLAWANNKVRWDAMHGYYTGLQAETVPQVSKVADNIYFSSWGVGNGGDNVVHNFNTMKVYAHLNSRHLWIPMDTIYGEVHCKDTPDCVRPVENMTQLDAPTREKLILENSAKNQLPPRRQRSLYITQLSKADVAARAELAGLTIKYQTPFGETIIEVDGVETRLSENQQDVLVYPTTATKIAEDIYFISWAGTSGGNHVIFNRQTMKAFDHILPSGERVESIYDLSCFDSASSC